MRVEDLESNEKIILASECNDDADTYFFGTRYFGGEPLLVPKNVNDSNPKEEEAYLLGVIFGAVKEKSFLAIFDLERDLEEGPIGKVWFKRYVCFLLNKIFSYCSKLLHIQFLVKLNQIPNGIHGCFVVNGKASDDSDDICYFC